MKQVNCKLCEVTRNSPHKRGAAARHLLTKSYPKSVHCYPQPCLMYSFRLHSDVSTKLVTYMRIVRVDQEFPLLAGALDSCSPKAIRCYPASPSTDNTVILLLSGTTRTNNTICCCCALPPIRWPPLLSALFIYMFLTFPNKSPTFLVLLTKSWTRGMDGGIPLEAVPNQLCSKHNSNETFVLPENGKSVHILRLCIYQIRTFSSAKSVFLS